MSPVIHRWTSPGLGSVNTYWIETESGVIVIDGQREMSKAKAVLKEIETSGKPVLAVFLTHPHPDHFGGIGVFAPAGSGIPVYGSRTTRDSIAEDRLGFVKASRETVGDDFPRDVTLPDHFIEDGDLLTLGGVPIAIHELGAGEAECMTVLYLPEQRALFSGDAIQHQMTAFLPEGGSGSWLEQLDRLEALVGQVDNLYPGHGEPGDPHQLIAYQKEYLNTFRAVVSSATVAGSLDSEAPDRIAALMRERYPGYVPVAAIPDLLTKNAAPIAKELGRAVPGEAGSA